MCIRDRATADSPQGPFTAHGKMFRSNEIGVQNSIDPSFLQYEGRNYLVWGSFRGIYVIELTADGLSIMPGAKKKRIAGTAFEAVYIHKPGDYYYMFASIGSCCQGEMCIRDRLHAAGIPLVDEFVSDNREEIVAFARRCGFPVVAKVVGPCLLYTSPPPL